MNEDQSPPTRFTFWWLHPAWLFATISGGTLVMAYLQSGTDFQLYRTVKYVDGSHVMLGLFSVLAFVGGCLFGHETTPTPKHTGWNRLTLQKCFYGGLALTIFGYAAWIGVGLKNGAGPSLFMELVLGDDPDVVELIREEYFVTIPGVTTCSQFALATMLTGTILLLNGDRSVLKWMVGLLGIAAFRAVLMSERLAIIELVVPPFILFLRFIVLPAKASFRLQSFGNALPFLAPLTLAVLFGGFEYFRSWKYYEDKFDTYPQFVVWRLSGYYTTPHNNAAMAIETELPRPLPYSTMEMLWKFPGVDKSPFSYEKLTRIDFDENYKQMLENYGNPELNNQGGLFLPMLDWGLPLSLVFWLGYGFVAGRCYRYFTIGSLPGLILYPVIFLSVTDIPRLLVLSNPRMSPSLALIALSIYLAMSKSEATE